MPQEHSTAGSGLTAWIIREASSYFWTNSASARKGTPTTEPSRKRLSIGSFPLLSMERKAHHLPEIPLFSAPPSRAPSPTISDSSIPSSFTSPPTLPLGTAIENNEQNTPIKPLENQVSHRNVSGRQGTHLSQTGPLQTCFREMERSVGISIEDISTRLMRLEQANDANDSSPYEGNEALRDEIRALREEVTMLRRTNGGTTNSNCNNNPASKSTASSVVSFDKDPTPLVRDSVSSPRVSTVNKDDEPRPARVYHDRSSSRHTARSSRRDSRWTSSRTKHDDTTETDSDGSLSDEKDPKTLAISFHQRRKGPKYPGLGSLVPSD